MFSQPMKSELLKRSYKKMYKNDINSLKEALIVIMPTLEATSPTEEESYESKMVEQVFYKLHRMIPTSARILTD